MSVHKIMSDGDDRHSPEIGRVLVLKCDDAEDATEFNQSLVESFAMDVRAVTWTASTGSDDPRYECCVLFLPREAHLWNELIKRTRKRRPGSPLFVAVRKIAPDRFGELLDYDIDDAFVYPTERSLL